MIFEDLDILAPTAIWKNIVCFSVLPPGSTVGPWLFELVGKKSFKSVQSTFVCKRSKSAQLVCWRNFIRKAICQESDGATGLALYYYLATGLALYHMYYILYVRSRLGFILLCNR